MWIRNTDLKGNIKTGFIVVSKLLKTFHNTKSSQHSFGVWCTLKQWFKVLVVALVKKMNVQEKSNLCGCCILLDFTI